MSSTFPLQAFLAGKSFIIPRYQRDYAWEKKEVRELFTDVQDALETGAPHFLGTIVLAQAKSVFEIVDGQQRLSTLMLMVHALLAHLDPADRTRIADEIYLLKQGETLKLDFGTNGQFVAAIFDGSSPTPRTRGQRRLAEAYRYCFERAHAIAVTEGNIRDWLTVIKSLEIIPFIETDSGRAIRIFQSINDRGRKLSDMDKAKALLVLYSNRFLEGELDSLISESFGTCFAAYDRARELAGSSGYTIELINRASFTENDLLRYHYLAYDAVEANDYYGYSDTILEHFLKQVLRSKQSDPDALRKFISDYVQDLEEFARAFSDMVGAVKSDIRLFTLLVVHGLAARLYPITIRLHQRSLLFQKIDAVDSVVDILRCIETVDLRVYKIRGTDPARDIGYLSHTSRNATVAQIADDLRSFLLDFMPDGLMQIHLQGRMYKSAAVVPILLAFEQQAIQKAHSLADLIELVQDEPSQEHVLSQQPSFDYSVLGFENQADFDEQLDTIGNLTLLTAGENTRCRNKPAELKMYQPDLYLASKFIGPRLLAQEFSVSGGRFDKVAIVARLNVLSQFAISNWSIW